MEKPSNGYGWIRKKRRKGTIIYERKSETKRERKRDRETERILEEVARDARFVYSGAVWTCTILSLESESSLRTPPHQPHVRTQHPPTSGHSPLLESGADDAATARRPVCLSTPPLCLRRPWPDRREVTAVISALPEKQPASFACQSALALPTPSCSVG